MADIYDPTWECSARIKNLYIELHDYAFFHGPSEVGHLDPRFIGREAIKKRLVALLSRNETKSGSYLLTGYRGAGKSSLVAKVLSEISARDLRSERRPRYYRLLLPLVPMSLLDVFRSSTAILLLFVLPVCLSIACFVYLRKTDPSKNNLNLANHGSVTRKNRKFRHKFSARVRSLARTLFLGEERSPAFRVRILLQDIFLLSGIQLFALAIFWIYGKGFTHPTFYVRLTTYLSLYVILVCFSVVIRGLRSTPRSSPSVRTALAAFAGRLWDGMRSYVNFSHRFAIRINLGQDDLKEEDILRLIARNVYTRYESFKRSAFTDLFWRTFRLCLIFFVVGTVYYYEPVYNLNKSLKLDSKLIAYLPSQGTFLLQHGVKTFESISTERERGGPFRMSSFYGDFQSHLAPDYRDLTIFPKYRFGWLGLLRKAGEYGLSYADLFMFTTYRKVRGNLPWPLSMLSHSEANALSDYYLKNTNIDSDFKLIPEQLDYLFILYLISTWLVLRGILRLELFGVVTHGSVLRRLRDLNDSLDAEITNERSGGLSVTKLIPGVNLLSRRIRRRAIPTLREIEKEILDILDNIDRLPRLTVRPEFIFVFDELDKIEPHKNVTVFEEEEEETQGADGGRLTSYEAARERQHRILELLSNLKHFFTTAKAKFLFIAGREMFDAALADVSDRHYFMGSIFNDVLYVPSFFRDPSYGRLSDVTNMTERYLCQFLLPWGWPSEEPSLREFNKYLASEYFHEEMIREEERSLVRRRREKIIYELHNFIIYVTYRSNGAPKKITRLIEEYICQPSWEVLCGETSLVVGKNERSLYLRFSFYDQYTFGLTAYLTQPLFLTLSRDIRNFGDKLVVSTSFILDHLYKFHGMGFSWRDLELIPELVDINRAPELRDLISTLIRFLKSTHISEILSGLYNFKFRRRIVEEIGYLSKISERESAAFNFTLDESLPIKRHYRRKLRRLLRDHGIETSDLFGWGGASMKDGTYIHSVGFLRMVLGDLHYYDQEYDHAITEYMEAVQVLQNIPSEKITLHLLVLMIRNFLKLGLVFEKKKTYVSAFIAYAKLVRTMVKFRAAQLLGRGDDTFPLSPQLRESEDPTAEHGVRREGAGGRFSIYRGAEDVAYVSSANSVQFGLSSTAFEGIRLIFQPILAKLQVIEKANLGGITVSDLEQTEREFGFLTEGLDLQEHFLVEAEFNSKVGNILFFKNGPVPQRGAVKIEKQQDAGADRGLRHGSKKSGGKYCWSVGHLCSTNRFVAERGGGVSGRMPCEACGYYMRSFEVLIERILDRSGRGPEGNVLVDMFEALERGELMQRRESAMKEMGSALSQIGDTFVSCSSVVHEQVNGAFVARSLAALGRAGVREGAAKSLKSLLKGRGSGGEEFSKIEEAILSYILSALFYQLAGDYKTYSFELTKVLYVLREYVALSGGRKRFSKSVLKVVEERLTRLAIRGVYQTYESAHRLEIERLQKILEEGEFTRQSRAYVDLNRVSLSREVREILVLFKEIELKLTPRRQVVPCVWFVSPYSSVNSMYNRIHELRYRASLNFHNLRALGLEWLVGGRRKAGAKSLAEQIEEKREECASIFGQGRRDVPPRLVVEFLITDSIFCFHELLHSLQVFGPSYMAGYVNRATAHDKLAWWCSCYFSYLAHTPDLKAKRRVEGRLESLIGPSELVSLTPHYHNELAMVEYHSAEEAHREGEAYRTLVSGMTYLTDDFNDKLTHFCAALERYRLRSGRVAKRVEALARRLEFTGLYSLERYFAGPEVEAVKGDGLSRELGEGDVQKEPAGDVVTGT